MDRNVKFSANLDNLFFCVTYRVFTSLGANYLDKH